MTVLVTGGTGFLGSHLVHALISSGHSVIMLKRPRSNLSRIEDLLSTCRCYDLSKTDLRTVFEENKIDVVVHCATVYGRASETLDALIEGNILFPIRLLELAKEFQLIAFVNIDTKLGRLTSTYSLSKAQFREWMRFASKGLRSINIALEHFFGPGDDSGKFVTGLIASLLKNQPRVSLTKGEQQRDLIFVTDVVDAILLVINNLDIVHDEDFEIGLGSGLTIRDFAELVKDCIPETESILGFGDVPYRENEVMAGVADLSAIKKLGWSPKVTLVDGIAKTVRYERDSQKRRD